MIGRIAPRLAGSLAFSLASLFVASAAEKPTFEHIYPTAIIHGSTNTFSLFGKFDPWPPKIWSSAKGLEFSFTTNKGTVQITASSDAISEAGILRLYNDEGASEPVIFVVSGSPQIDDTEPNNHFAKDQILTNLPVTVSGRLDKNNDVDSYAFSIKAGQWLDAKVESHTLMSKLDAVLRLVNTNGFQLAWNHDFSSLDPRLIWQAPYDLSVVLQVFGFVYPAGSEIVLSGGNGGVYQLRVATADEPPRDLSEPLNESEKSNATNSCPVQVLGSISPAGDEDRFPIFAKKDEWLEIRANAMEFGSDLDPWLKIEDSTGKELARNDDVEGARDARLEWKIPADGQYFLVIGSMTRQGYEGWRYRLSATKIEPDYIATLPASSLVLESTGTNELKITTKRLRDFTNELTVAMQDLPEGLTVEPVKIDGKAGEAALKLITTNTPAFNGPVKVVVTDTATGEKRAARFELVSRTENNGVPGGYSKLLVESIDHLWLTVKPAKEATPANP